MHQFHNMWTQAPILVLQLNKSIKLQLNIENFAKNAKKNPLSGSLLL